MKDEFGLNQSLKLVGLPKNTWYYYQKYKVDYDQKYWQAKQDLLKALMSRKEQYLGPWART